MTKTKHTPGDWFPVGSYVEVADDEVPDIAVCDPEVFGQGHLPRLRDEILANVRLIAAAPYMLAALKQIASRPEDYLTAEDWDIVLGAIANAEGAEP